ncbi:ribbon-helix-helix domain-containing protein [Sphingobium cloacae]|uniref:CopG family transcriptional regulator n=1 Tax=Sphingobium cloacae TaxID=120107 RepID=A0A1E1F0S6_9SPHN|nr:hypothetical protein [Sphingobium cloacae]BAV64107.1 hypothetical protein SCLO_1010670 [Sphingobium cloacae]
MIRGKTRHQLFLPDEMSKRLTAMAKSQKRARSDLLLEMVEAYLNRRAANDADSLERKLSRIARAVEDGNREAFFISHSLQRFLRFYLIHSAMQPRPGEDAIAAGEKAYRQFIDAITRMLAQGVANDNSAPGAEDGQ